MTAVGKGFVAILATNERGSIERRPATTRREAFAVARDLSDEAERREFNRGEIVRVEVAQADE
jgi:hypothetical protein